MLFSTVLSAQQVDYSLTDKKAAQIPGSQTQNPEAIASYINATFQTEQERIRAIFYLTATLLEYDLSLLKDGEGASPEANIAYGLTHGKGVCQHYAEIFAAICQKVGIKAHVVDGYSRQSESSQFVSHAWCAAFIDNSWSLYDPTWSSGYVEKRIFHPKFTNEYFQVQPAEMIKTHMPFDPLNEFLRMPVTRDEFNAGQFVKPSATRPFNFTDTLMAMQQLPEIERLKETYTRIERNGTVNAFTRLRLSYLKQEIAVLKQNQLASQFNDAVTLVNEGVNGYNVFISYRNNRFKPEKPDSVVKSMTDKPESQLKEALVILKGLKPADAYVRKSIAELINSVTNALYELTEQQAFLKRYLNTEKSRRKELF